MKYERITTPVEAFQWDGTIIKEVQPDWFFEEFSQGNIAYIVDPTKSVSPFLKFKGVGSRSAQAFVGDYIVKNEKGLIYPLKETNFVRNFQEVKPPLTLEPANRIATIQTQNKLNEVYAIGERNAMNKGFHRYMVKRQVGEGFVTIAVIDFQNGPRDEKGSIPGVLDVDLLEIVRNRLICFQTGPYAMRENMLALTAVESALLWLNKRVEDRAREQKLGTNKV